MFGDYQYNHSSISNNSNSNMNVNSNNNNNSNNMGIIPQIIDDLFMEIDGQKNIVGTKNITLSCSMFQIYKENINDLMTDKQKQIKIKQASNGSVQIENLVVKQVASKEQLIEWMNQGSQLRKTRGTDMNQRSSRSHLIFTLYLVVKINDFQSKMSKLNLVDLAGSQKVSKTKVSGEGLEQAIKINLSLSCLGNTIHALSRGQQHVPFRDSKLTRVLQQSLSGNSITRVIVTCSMLPSCKQQTISSLKFANRIKKIKTQGSQNLRRLNQQGINKFMYQTLKTSFQNCQEKLQKIKSVVDSSFSVKMSKQQIAQAIKSILTTNEQKLASQNQFLPPYISTLQTFRSPTKDEHFMTQYYQTVSQVNQKSHERNNSLNIDLNIQIKNLEAIVMKQEAVIQAQIIQIQKLKKANNINNLSINRDHENKKANHKLKILKTNSNNNKMKASLSQNKEGKFGKQNIVSTLKQKPIRKQHRQQALEVSQFPSLQWAKQILDEYSKQRKSYEAMQKQILTKQVKALGVQVNQLRKIVQQSGNVQKISRISNSKSLLLTEKQPKQQQHVLRRQMKQRDAYIEQLQKIIASRIGLLHDNPSKSTSLAESVDLRTVDLKGMNNAKSISLFASPTASCAMSRISSAKYLTKLP